MAVSGIAATAHTQPSQQVSPSSAHHHHHGGHPSISDVDGQSSSVTPSGNSAAKIGGKVNITV